MNIKTAQDILNFIPGPSILLSSNGKILGTSPTWSDWAEEFKGTDLFNFQTSSWLQQIQICLSEQKNDFKIDFSKELTTTPDQLRCWMRRLEGAEGAYVWVSMIGLQVFDHDIQNRKLKEMSEMAAAIAHEISNPLTVIFGKLQSLQQTLRGQGTIDKIKITSGLEKIGLQADRICKIVGGMKSFSRDSRRDPFIQSSLQKVLDEAFSLVALKTRSQKVSVEIAAFNPGLMILCRPSELIQVFINLATNAMDAMKDLPSPKISISVEEHSESVVIYFKDSGAGISLENEEKVFAPFFTTKAVGQGTGIGLSISTRIILSHQGSLRLDRSRGLSCFAIELPKAHSNKLAS